MTIEQFNETGFKSGVEVMILDSGEVRKVISIDFRRKYFITEDDDNKLKSIYCENVSIIDRFELELKGLDKEEIIQKIVASYFGITVFKMIQNSRIRQYLIPRQISQEICWQYNTRAISNGLDYIGSIHGGLSRASVMHSIKAVKNMQDTNEYILFIDKKFNVIYDDLKRKIETSIKSSTEVQQTQNN